MRLGSVSDTVDDAVDFAQQPDLQPCHASSSPGVHLATHRDSSTGATALMRSPARLHRRSAERSISRVERHALPTRRRETIELPEKWTDQGHPPGGGPDEGGHDDNPGTPTRTHSDSVHIDTGAPTRSTDPVLSATTAIRCWVLSTPRTTDPSTRSSGVRGGGSGRPNRRTVPRPTATIVPTDKRANTALAAGYDVGDRLALGCDLAGSDEVARR